MQAQLLWLVGLVAPCHVGSSRTRAQTRVPCIGRRIFNYCATREAQEAGLIVIRTVLIRMTWLGLICRQLLVLEGEVCTLLPRGTFPASRAVRETQNLILYVSEDPRY